VKKRLFFLAIAALSPGVAILAINEIDLRSARERDVHQQALQASRHAASEMGRVIEGIDGLLTAVAANAAVFSAERASCQSALLAVATAIPSIRTIFVMTPDGTISCDSHGTAIGQNMADRSYFTDALAEPGIVVGEYTRSRIADLAVLPVSKAVREGNGRVTAVLATGIRLDWLGERLRERGMSSGGALTVADRDGVILARHPQGDRFVGTRIPDEYQHLVKAAEPGTIELRSQDGETRITGYQPANTQPRGLYISAGLSRSEAFAAINRASLIGALFILAGSLSAFALAWFVGDAFIRRPIRRIVGVLDDWREGSSRTRTGMKASQGELESVGASVDALLDALARRDREARQAEQQRELLMRELSHRVKNTLTILQAIARQTFGPYVEQERSRIFADRVVALSGALDVLLSDERQAGDIASVLVRTLKPHDDATNRIRISGPPVGVNAATALALSMVIHELATNAVKYGALSRDEGIVTVEWRVDPRSVRLRLTWQENGGPPVTPPSTQGFGSKLIQRAFPPDLDAVIETNYRLEGLVCSISFAVAQERDQAA
jgi:two-component sensor histidine kinase